MNIKSLNIEQVNSPRHAPADKKEIGSNSLINGNENQNGDSNQQRHENSMSIAENKTPVPKTPSNSLSLEKVVNRNITVDRKQKSIYVLKGHGKKAKIINSKTGDVVWQPDTGIISEISINNDGRALLVHFASDKFYKGNSVILSVPQFTQISTLPLKGESKRSRGITWRWLGESQLIGVSKIEKTSEALSKMTSLEQESDLAIEKTVLYIYDISTNKFSQIKVPIAMPEKFEYSGINQKEKAIQLWIPSQDGIQIFQWFKVK